MTTTDPITLALTGQLPFILSLSAVLAFPISFFLLYLYRRAVLRGMARRSTKPVPQPEEPVGGEEASPVPGILRISIADAAERKAKGEAEGRLYQLARAAPWRASLIYAAGGLVFASVMALSFLISGDMEILPLRFLLLLTLFAWPLVPTLASVAGTGRKTNLLIAAAYAGLYIALATAGLIRSPESSAGELFILWVTTNIPPTILLLVFLVRRVRAVGPLVVTFMVFALTGSNIILSVLERNEALSRTVADALFSIGLGGTGAFVALIITGLCLFAIIGWFALLWIRRRYVAKKANDQSLILDALWLLFGISYAIGLAFEGAPWVLSGIAAFAGYKAMVRLGFRIIAPLPSRQGIARLLVLRVFSLGKRSEELFQAISRGWRYIGHVQLIAGPDLAAATVEPHEFLDFLSGRLSRQFIDGPEALSRRMVELDATPDFDGRFRVNDYFCHDDTWQMTLGELVNHSDAVLMDLRGFTRQNAGCAYELQALVNTTSLGKVVLTVDSTADSAFLEQTLREEWESMRPGSPNRKGSCEVRIFRLDGPSDRSVQSLLRLLCMATGERASGDRVTAGEGERKT